jgi:hypothetical protein
LANLPLAISAITIRSTAPDGVTARMVAGQEPDGLAPVEYSSGPFTWGEADGRQVLQTQANPESTTSGNLYMAVDDRYLSGGPQRAWLVLTYLPQAAGRFQVQYENAAVGTTYYNATAVEVTADQVGTWQTTTVDLPDAAFNNRQNGAADFRLRLPQNYPMAISEMRLTTIDPADTPTDPPTEEEPPTIPGSVLNPVSWSPERAGGLGPIAYESGPFTVESDGTGSYLQVQRNTINSGNNLYLTADDATLFGGPHEVWFTIEYRSPVEGTFELQYEDATDRFRLPVDRPCHRHLPGRGRLEVGHVAPAGRPVPEPPERWCGHASAGRGQPAPADPVDTHQPHRPGDHSGAADRTDDHPPHHRDGGRPGRGQRRRPGGAHPPVQHRQAVVPRNRRRHLRGREHRHQEGHDRGGLHARADPQFPGAGPRGAAFRRRHHPGRPDRRRHQPRDRHPVSR